MSRRLAVLVYAVAAFFAMSVLSAGGAQASETDCMSYGYACTPGYTGSNASGTWAWTYYGGSWAQTANGYHNCTLYVAWRLQQSGMGNPQRSWGNAKDWSGSIGGGNHTPTVGSVAWWGAQRGGGSGHVAYVEQVSGANVYVRADNYSTGNGYTTAGWISSASVDLFLHPHDAGGGSASVGDGSFVSYQGNVYRIAGGAPVYVGTWSTYGGPQPTTALSDSQWASLRYYPADGTFVSAAPSGQVFRFAGGAPIYVGSWGTYGGAQPTVGISDDDVKNAGATDPANPWSHVRYYPADGTFVSAAPSGQVFRFAGGAPIYVGSWSTYGGAQPTVGISDDDVKNAGATDPANPWSHVRYYPADGTFVSAAPSGQVFRFAGGAPIYVGSWSTYGGAQPTVGISDDDVKNAGATDPANPWSHLRFYPAGGTFLSASPSGKIYRVNNNGAPVYVPSWTPYGGPQPSVGISDDNIRNAGATDPTNPWSHLKALASA